MKETDEKETKPNVAEQLVGSPPSYRSTLALLSHCLASDMARSTWKIIQADAWGAFKRRHQQR